MGGVLAAFGRQVRAQEARSSVAGLTEQSHAACSLNSFATALAVLPVQRT